MIGFNQSISRFSIALFLTLTIAFAIHLAFLHFYFPSYSLWVVGISYFVNYLMGIGITYGLFRLKDAYAHTLGFIFMAGSMLKFIVFFLLLHPLYNTDGDVSRVEFAYFFIPYAIALAFETLFISRILNQTKF